LLRLLEKHLRPVTYQALRTSPKQSEPGLFMILRRWHTRKLMLEVVTMLPIGVG